MEFGEYFRGLRKQKKKTQAEIAEMINKSPMLVCGVERGKNNPFSESDLAKIADGLVLSENERRELYYEAAVASNGLPGHLWNYLKKHKDSYLLLEYLTELSFTTAELKKLKNYAEEMKNA